MIAPKWNHRFTRKGRSGPGVQILNYVQKRYGFFICSCSYPWLRRQNKTVNSQPAAAPAIR